MGKSTEDLPKLPDLPNLLDIAQEASDAVRAVDGYPPSDMPVTLRLRHGFGRVRPRA